MILVLKIDYPKHRLLVNFKEKAKPKVLGFILFCFVFFPEKQNSDVILS